jgi:peroxiredoxin
MLNTNDLAPDFELPSTKGDSFRLSAALEKNPVLLAFYPFDWSPVCTNELGYLNVNIEHFRRNKTALAAISVDSPFSHAAWAKSQKLKFPLLSDFNREVTAAYGVLCEEYHGLRQFAKRAVFLIGTDGKVRYAWVTEDPGVEPCYSEIMQAVEGEAGK